jgi:hypothetical protein
MVEHGVTPRGIVAFLWLELILARNNADWCRLLDLCALTDRLIAELMRSRLTVGLRHKAARGELRLLQGRLRRGKCVVLASGSLGFLAAVRH